MRIGVTGSSGFIGSALVEALVERGDDVVRFVRPDTSPRVGNTIRWDPSRALVDDDDLRRVGGFDAVVNLAGAGIADRRWTASRKGEIQRSRRDATTLLVRLLQESSQSPFLASASAIGIYGSRGDELLDESSTTGDDYLARVCSEWEGATAPLERSGSNVAHLRTGIVMSRRGGALKRQLPLFRLGLGGALGTGAQWTSPISLRDEIRAITFLLETRPSGAFNLVAPAPVMNRDFTTVLARQLRRPARLRVPTRALAVVLGTELVDAAVLASQRVVPAALLAAGFSFESPDIDSIVSSALS
jgi:uncharacterized protein (TIGR01777 family)